MGQSVSFYDLFSAQCSERPDEIAVISGDKSYTYRDLSGRINRICDKLSHLSGDVVAIMTKRNINLIAGIFAIVKAGKIYLPIDASLPPERKKYMLESCNPTVLTQKEIYPEGYDCIFFDDFNFDDDVEFEGRHDARAVCNEAAYIIFTSGSTGAPKGVVVKNDALVNLIDGIAERIDFSPGRKMTSFTTISFDMFAAEGIAPLCRGMTLILADEAEQTNPRKMARLIEESGADIVEATSSRMRLLADSDPELKCMKNVKAIMIGAEAVPMSIVKTLQTRTNAKIYNMYGPTEATVWSSIGDLTSKDRVDIGTPIKGTEFHILDESLRPVPDGETGEICISGAGLAAGYWKRDDLTAERFVSLPSKRETRIYRTGDLGRRLPDGAYECLGRVDNQIKVRGYRVELEEIESVINDCDGVKQSLAAFEGDEGSGVLIAFYVSEHELDERDIARRLADRLPAYMLPSRYIRVSDFCYTPNGKLDRKVDYGRRGDAPKIAGSAAIEDRVIGAIELAMEKSSNEAADIGHCSSLTSLGLDSLSFARVVFAIEKKFSIAFDDDAIAVRRFMTIGDLARYVEAKLDEKRQNADVG
jgi:amino acid adenylation domain-containing protein